MPAAETVKSLLSRPGGLPPDVSARRFSHRGLDVVELVASPWDGHRKLVWCLHPFEGMVVAGRLNPLFHADFAEEAEAGAARERVRQAFEEHYRDRMQLGAPTEYIP